MYLLINQVKYPVKLDSVSPTIPSVYRYEVTNRQGLPWKPKIDPLMIPNTFHWGGSNVPNEKTPEVLVTTQGAPVSCQLIDQSGQIMYDFGDKIYLQREGGGCYNGQWHLSLKLSHYYVGMVDYAINDVQSSVKFKYEHGFLFPLSCQYRGQQSSYYLSFYGLKG